VLDSESAGVFATVSIHRPELPQPQLETLGNGSLRSQAAEDQLSGRVNPMRRQGANHLAPDPLLKRVEICGRLRPAGTRDQHRDDGERC
jgi:hypothetical protein